MARPTAGSKARSHMVNVRLTDDGLAALDRLRGTLNRSDYIRALLSEQAAREAKLVQH